MDPIRSTQNDAEIGHEPKKERTNVDFGEDEAIRKVEAANTPDLNAQSGVQKVEAVTLAWTKTSLACAFVWYVTTSLSLEVSKGASAHNCNHDTTM